MSPNDRSIHDGLSRRRVLAASGAAAVAVTGGCLGLAQEGADDNGTGTNGTTTNGTATEAPPEAVAGDERLETRALIIPPEGWNRPLDGAFVHVGGEVDPASAAGSDQCDYATWPDKRSRSYDVTLIAPEDLLETQRPTTLYLPARLELSPGALFMVEEVHDCPSSYTGLYLRRLGIKNVSDPSTDPGDVQIGVTDNQTG